MKTYNCPDCLIVDYSPEENPCKKCARPVMYGYPQLRKSVCDGCHNNTGEVRACLCTLPHLNQITGVSYTSKGRIEG